MSEVVLRCPSCGTTQSHTGECDACSQSAVRYFCTNHTPGLWLDEAECKNCGAQFGVTSKKARMPPSRTTSGAAARSARSTARPEPPRPKPRGPEPSPRPERSPDRVVPSAAPSIAELLARLSAARPKRAAYEADDAWGSPPPAVPRLRLGGCLFRLMLSALLLLVLAVAGSFIFVGSMLQFFSAADTAIYAAHADVRQTRVE